MRLGVLWFVALLVSHLLGAFAVAVLFGLVAGVSALQTSAAWSRHKVPVNQLAAGVGAFLLPVTSWFGFRLLGAGMILMALAPVVMGSDVALPRSIPKGPQLRANLEAASTTLRSGLFFGMAGAAAVAATQVDPMAFVFLVSMVCVFDAGDYLMGAGYDSHFAGPLGGSVGVLLVAVALGQLPPAPFESGSALVVGVLCALACPAGQMLTSWLLPLPHAPSPGARRLDAWLIAAPVVAIAATMAT